MGIWQVVDPHLGRVRNCATVLRRNTNLFYLLPRDKHYVKNVVVKILSDFKPL